MTRDVIVNKESDVWGGFAWYDEDYGAWHGRVTTLNGQETDEITFCSDYESGLKAEMDTSITEHLAFCKRVGK